MEHQDLFPVIFSNKILVKNYQQKLLLRMFKQILIDQHPSKLRKMKKVIFSLSPNFPESLSKKLFKKELQKVGNKKIWLIN